MAAIADLELSMTLTGTEGTTQLAYEPEGFRWSPSVGKREDISLTGSAFTALSPPTNTKLAVIVIPTTATSLSLKSVTGDGGIAVVPASNFVGLPLILPMGATPSVGFLNSGSTVAITVYWL